MTIQPNATSFHFLAAERVDVVVSTKIARKSPSLESFTGL